MMTDGIDSVNMARSKPRPYHHGDLPEALIAASIAILDAEGIAALTLRSAARRVGVSHAAPKNHFGDLRGLLAAVAREGFERLRDAMQRAADEHDDPVEQLLATGRAYVRFAGRSPGHFRAMFHPALGPREPGSALEQASSAALGVLITAVTTAQRAGRLRAEDTVEQSLAAWSMVHGLATLAVDGQLASKGLPSDADALAERFGRYLYDGLRVRDEPAPSTPRRKPRRG
jgi:AcrR family transcriptional regulator